MPLTYSESVSMARTAKSRMMLKTLPPSCTDFINHIAMTTSSLTRLAYTIDLESFFQYLHQELPHFADKEILDINDDDIGQLTVRDLDGYMNYLTLYFKQYQDASGETKTRVLRNHECGVMRKLSSLRSYFDFLMRQERIKGNTASLVNLPKLHEKPILHLIGEEIEKLLAVAETGNGLTDTQHRYHQRTKERDYALIMLFLGTGMRVSECVSINIADFDFEVQGVLVTRKGGNQVILYFPDEVSHALKQYLAVRNDIKALPEHEDAMFLSLQKKRISQRAVQKIVKKYSAIAVPLKSRMSPHKLRSTYATRLYHETEDIYLVADALGHADVNTTRKHYAAMTEQRRRDAARNVHLPKKAPVTEASVDDHSETNVD